jgi:addiction module HigA family antidote
MWLATGTVVTGRSGRNVVVEQQTGCARRDPRRFSGSNGATLPPTRRRCEVEHDPLSRHSPSATIRITTILKGQRGLTADTALRLARYFGTTPDWWLNLQKDYELRLAKDETAAEIESLVRPMAA